MTDFVTDTNLPTRPFVILSSQRSGSTFVRIWLNQHPKIHSYGEVFLGHYESADGFRAYCARDIKSRLLFKVGHARLAKVLRLDIFPRHLVEGYLRLLCHGKNNPAPWTDIVQRTNDDRPRTQKPVIGFKVMYNTLAQYRSLDKWLDEQRPWVIHLTRHNLLRQYASLVRMGITRLAHSEDHLSARSKIHINVDGFLKFAGKQTELVNEYRDRLKDKMPYLELSYEEFFADTEESKKAILEFLGVEDEEMPFHKMKKLGSTRLSDDIENWEELLGRLSGTVYASCLDAPESAGVGGNGQVVRTA